MHRTELKELRKPKRGVGSDSQNENYAQARRDAVARGCVLGWTRRELAVSLGVSEGFVDKQIREGRLVALKLGRRQIITEKACRDYLSGARAA